MANIFVSVTLVIDLVDNVIINLYFIIIIAYYLQMSLRSSMRTPVIRLYPLAVLCWGAACLFVLDGNVLHIKCLRYHEYLKMYPAALPPHMLLAY